MMFERVVMGNMKELEGEIEDRCDHMEGEMEVRYGPMEGRRDPMEGKWRAGAIIWSLS